MERRRRLADHPPERFHPTAPNQVWTMAVVADQLADGKRFRSLTVVDLYTRECLAIGSEQRLQGEDVVVVLNQVKVQSGVPRLGFYDNGSEFSSVAKKFSCQYSESRIGGQSPLPLNCTSARLISKSQQ